MDVFPALKDLRERVVTFNDILTSGRLLQEIILDNEPYIVDMNAEEQLFEQGVNRLGVKISDYAPYSPITIEIKEAKGQPTNRVTLRDTGEFEASFFLIVGTDKFEVRASDFKTEDLTRKYGEQILGLTDESIKSLIWEYIYPDVMDALKQILWQ